MITAIKTNVGRVRPVNEDHAYACPDLNGFAVAVVADGMGGHQAGDVASQLAVDTVVSELQSIHHGLSVEQCEEAVREAIDKANTTIYRLGTSEGKYLGMGTTIVVAVAHHEVAIVGHIGDSRAYRWKDGTIMQITEDHTLVNELFKSGQITYEESLAHPRKHVVSRALGTDETETADIQRLEWGEGEMLLLCSDGLTNLVSDEQIAETLRKGEQLDRKAERLIQYALQAGGDDNVTVVLLSNEPAATDKA